MAASGITVEWQLRHWQVPLVRTTAFIFAIFITGIPCSPHSRPLSFPLVTPVLLIDFLFIFLYYFLLFFLLPYCLLLLFYFPVRRASPLCQHFTVDIQLLAGHNSMVSFRAVPFSMGLKLLFKSHPCLPPELLLCKMLFSNISGATT